MALAPKCRLVYSAIDNLQVPRSRSMRRSSPISDFPTLRRRICASVAASAPRLAPLQVQASIAPGPCCTRWAAVWDLYRRLRTTPRGRACGHPRTCTRPPVRRYGLGPSPSRRAGDPCGASPLGSSGRASTRGCRTVDRSTCLRWVALGPDVVGEWIGSDRFARAQRDVHSCASPRLCDACAVQ